jgi:hypothetical protein
MRVLPQPHGRVHELSGAVRKFAAGTLNPRAAGIP